MNTIVNIGDKVQFTNREIITFDDKGATLLEIGKIYTIRKTNVTPFSKVNPNLIGYRYVCLEEIPVIWFDKVLFKQLDNKRELNIIGIHKSNNDLDKIDFQVYYDDKLVSDVVFTCDVLEFRNSVNSENVIKVSYYEDNLCKSCIINTKGKHFPYESWSDILPVYVRNNTYVRKQKDKRIYTINCLDTGKELVKFVYNNTFVFKENKFFGVIDDNKDYNKKFTLNTITKEITYI